MIISGIICELNPFHGGHEYVFKKAKKGSDFLVAIMSGSFVQRGECALFDKYKRAEYALKMGADLVLELPFPWSAAPAEFFARGAVCVGKAIGINRLVFGSECGETERLNEAAELFSKKEFLALIEREYTDNTGYATARERACEKMASHLKNVFASSNDMLAVEYIKAARKLGFDCEFKAVKREEGNGYMSASTIRRLVRENKLEDAFSTVPESLRNSYIESVKNGDFALCDSLFDAEYTAFRLGLVNGDSFDSESGILSRIISSSNDALNGEEMMLNSATKKYTDARIKRCALFALTGVDKRCLEEYPSATYVLGANEKGRELLSAYRRNSDFGFVTKPSECPECLTKTREADSLYTFLLSKKRSKGWFLKQKPVIF